MSAYKPNLRHLTDILIFHYFGNSDTFLLSWIYNQFGKEHIWSLYIYGSHSYFTTFWPHKGSKIVFITGLLHIFFKRYADFYVFPFKYIVHYQNSCKNQVWNPFPWVCTKHPKLGVFCYFPKYSILGAVTSQFVKKLQQRSLHEVIQNGLWAKFG